MPRRWKVINKRTGRTIKTGYRTKTRARGYSKHLNKLTFTRQFTIKKYFV